MPPTVIALLVTPTLAPDSEPAAVVPTPEEPPGLVDPDEAAAAPPEEPDDAEPTAPDEPGPPGAAPPEPGADSPEPPPAPAPTTVEEGLVPSSCTTAPPSTRVSTALRVMKTMATRSRREVKGPSPLPAVVEELDDERVGRALAADGRGRTVAGQDLDVVGEGEDLRCHRVHQLVVASARQVGPSDRPGEQVVAGEQDGRLALDLQEEAGGALGVARGVDGRKGQAGAGDPLPVVEALDQLRGAQVEPLGRQHPAERSAGAHGVEEHVAVVIVDAHRHRLGLGPDHRGDPTDVVHVAVGGKQGHEAQLLFGQAGQDGRRVGWGVDDHALPPGAGGRHDPAVRLRQPQGDALYAHRVTIPPVDRGSRRAARPRPTLGRPCPGP